MTKTDSGWRDFVAMLTPMARYYNAAHVDEAVIALMWTVLCKYSMHDLRRAAQAIITENNRMPTVADFVRHIEGDASDVSYTAWAAVQHAINSCRHTDRIQFDDDGIYHALEYLGGFEIVQSLCRQSADQVQYMRRDFCRAYTAGVRCGAAGPINRGCTTRRLWHVDHTGARVVEPAQVLRLPARVDCDGRPITEDAASTTHTEITEEQRKENLQRIQAILSDLGAVVVKIGGE